MRTNNILGYLCRLLSLLCVMCAVVMGMSGYPIDCVIVTAAAMLFATGYYLGKLRKEDDMPGIGIPDRDDKPHKPSCFGFNVNTFLATASAVFGLIAVSVAISQIIR